MCIRDRITTGRPISSGRRTRSTATKNESRSTWTNTSRNLAVWRRLGTSVNRTLVPDGARRFGEHLHVFLERRNQVGHDLERQDDLDAHRRLDHCLLYT